MSEWFKKDNKNVITGDDSIFTDDDEIEKEFDDELIKLMELGIAKELIEQYRSHYKNKNVFYGGKLTKQFFEWILNSCNKDELWLIKEHYDKYPKQFQEMIDNTKPHTLGQENPVWKDDKDELMHLASLAKKRGEYLKFFWEFMGRALDETYEVNEGEIKMLNLIKEDLK